MNRRPIINLLIVDLDNTLYDWMSYFVPAFYCMVDVAVKLLSVDREQLLNEFRVIHQKYHNSEHPFALLETHTVKCTFPHASRYEKARLLDDAFHAFNKVRKESLSLYPGVREALAQIRASGAIIVAHTEATIDNSLYRLLRLNLHEYVERLYAPEARGLGHPDPTRRDIFAASRDLVRLLPEDHRKPNPEVLKDICAEYVVPAEAALYVGDSLTRDIFMAKTAGLYAAWARYGTIYESTLWPKLVRVTHWTEKDVKREEKLRIEARGIRPDIELECFTDLIDKFAFSAPTSRLKSLSSGSSGKRH